MFAPNTTTGYSSTPTQSPIASSHSFASSSQSSTQSPVHFLHYVSTQLSLPSLSHPIPISGITIDLPLLPSSVPTSTSTTNSHHMITRSKSQIPSTSHPSTSLVSSSIVSKISSLDTIEPHNFKEAIQHPKWFNAMYDEYSALLKQQT
ncbi:hypothetical protein U1Q18_017074 [Sarracenia purpurea var. burkii]